jgi:glutathione S-transferase
VNELSIEKIYNGFRGVPPNEERVEKLKEGLAVKLEGYERILSKQRYLAGANVTLADLSHLPTGIVLSQIGINFLEDDQKYPNVARYVFLTDGAKSLLTFNNFRWWKELQERPSWKAVLEKSST